MSKTQKIILVLALVLMLIFAYSIKVNAASMTDLVDWNVATNDGNTYTLNANDDGVKQDIFVKSGESLELDLNGQTLTNFTDGCSTITVEEGGTLTLLGVGTVTNKSLNNVPTITNNGALIISGGNITSENTNYATCVLNNGELHLNGGTITTTTQNCWGLTNEGTAEITGGVFEQKGNFSVIMNAGNMKISGGNINVTSGYSAITNESDDASASLTISNVTVTGAKNIIANPDGESVVVTGGTYGTDTNITDYIDDSYVVDENGEVVEAPELPDPTPVDPPKEDEDSTDEPSTGDEVMDNKVVDNEVVDNEVVDNETVDNEVVETNDTVDSNVTEEVSENPQTGDTIIVFASIFAVAIVGLVATLIAKKRTK